MEPTVQSLVAVDPAIRLAQIGVLSGAAVLLFLLFWTLKDMLARSRSFSFHLFSILLVTALPVFGFLVYLLLCPGTTLHEREMMKLLQELKRENGKSTKHVKKTKEEE